METTRSGTFTSSEGYNGGKSWHQNQNGQVIVERGEIGDDDEGEDDEAVEILSREHSPIDAFVIDSLAADGTSTRRFYDAQSFLLVRRERVQGGIHFYAIFDNFATDGAGRTVARHRYGGDQRPNNEWDERLVSTDFTTAVAPSDVAIPAAGRTLVEFPSGRTTVRLPARIVSGLIVVRVQIGERGVDFIIDSGADSIVLDTTIASELGLTPEGRHTATIAGDVEASTLRVPRMKIGDLTLNDVAVDALPLSWNIDDQTKAAGLLGFDFLIDSVVSIDYQKGTVDATKPSAYVPEPGVPFVDARLNSGVPEVNLTIGSSTGDRFIVDTGAQQSMVDLFDRFVRMHTKHIDPSTKNGDQIFTDMIGGTVENRQVAFADITFGPWVLAGARGLLSRSPPAFQDIDGLIGSGLLSNFRVTLDEPHAKIYLQPAGVVPSPSPRPSGK